MTMFMSRTARRVLSHPLPLLRRASRGAGVAALATVAACASLGRPTPPALDGREWRLVELRGQPAVPSSGMRHAHLRFSPESMRVVGSGGCNGISGTYTRDGDRLTFGSMISTRMACADARLNRQETDFLTAIVETNRYSLVADTLTLARDGERLVRLVGAPR